MAAADRPKLVDAKRVQRPVNELGLPCEPELEKLILGGIFSSKDPNGCFLRVSELIGEADFSLEKTRSVFLAMRQVVSHDLAIGYATVLQELRRTAQLWRVVSLIDLTEGAPELVNIEGLCRMVAEAAERRRFCVHFHDLQTRVLHGDCIDAIATASSDFISSFRAKHDTADIDRIESVHSISTAGIQFAVPDLIALSAITAITGDAGTGKTTLTTAAAGHIACGADFLGRHCDARQVLILDRENTLPVVQERLKRLGIQDGGNLKISGGWRSQEIDPGSQAVLQWVTKTDPKPVIIVDSFIAFLDGDENDSGTVRAFMHTLRRLADAGAAVVVLHHSGKSESSRDYRGSSDFKAGIDVGYSLVNFGENQLGRLRLRAFKTRFTVATDLIVNYVDGEFLGDSRPAAVSQTVTERLTELLRRNPGVTVRAFQDLAVKDGLGQNRAFDFLKDGAEAGWVRREKGTRNSMLHY